MYNIKSKTRQLLRKEKDIYKKRLVELFESVSGCSIKEFDKESLPYLSDMIQGQMDADEMCIAKLKSQLKNIKEDNDKLQGMLHKSLDVVSFLNVGYNQDINADRYLDNAKKLLKELEGRQ